MFSILLHVIIIIIIYRVRPEGRNNRVVQAVPVVPDVLMIPEELDLQARVVQAFHAVLGLLSYPQNLGHP